MRRCTVGAQPFLACGKLHCFEKRSAAAEQCRWFYIPGRWRTCGGPYLPTLYVAAYTNCKPSTTRRKWATYTHQLCTCGRRRSQYTQARLPPSRRASGVTECVNSVVHRIRDAQPTPITLAVGPALNDVTYAHLDFQKRHVGQARHRVAWPGRHIRYPRRTPTPCRRLDANRASRPREKDH